MKKYITPSVSGSTGGGRAIPALIAGVSLAKAFAAGAAIAVGSSLLKKDIVADVMPALEPCLE